MRAPLLRLALLLAAAQYAEASGCPGAPAPKLTFQVVDPDVAAAEVDCKDFDLDNTAACDPTHKIFMQQGSKWTEVNEVKCDTATVKWTAAPTDGGAKVELTSNEIVVCAKLAPDTKKCGACANILKKACTGATCGGDLTEGISAARCREFGCGSAEVLEVDGDKKLGAAEKITCTDQKKWTSSVGDVTEAVCVKNAPPPGPSCSAILAPCDDAAIVDPAAGCIPPTSPGDVLTCADASSSKLFVDTGAGWKEDAGKCVSGKWTLSGATPTEIKKAVCAKKDPTPPSTSTVCQPVVDSCADGSVKTGATFKCKKPDPDSANTVLNCAAPTPDLYAFIGTNWEKGAATCDAGTWKMDVNTVATAFTKAVCANENPTAAPPPGVSCKTSSAFTPKCDTSPTGDVLATVNCVPATLDDDAPISCTPPSPDLYIKQGASGSWAKKTVECDKGTGKWKVDGQTVVDANKLITNAICISGNAPPSAAAPPAPCVLCPTLPTSTTCTPATGCTPGDELSVTDDAQGCTQVTCPAGQLLDINGGDDQTEKITCSSANAWEVDTLPVTDAICVKKFVCSIKNPLKMECSAFAPDIACEALTLTDDGLETGCPDGKHLFYKRAGDAHWVKSTRNIKCETTGKWNIDTDDKEMIKDDELICAAKNPGACKGCVPVSQSTACVTVGGAAVPCTESTTQFTTALAMDAASCQQMKCVTLTDVLFINDATVLAPTEIVTCGADDKWKDKDGTEITKAVCVSAINCQAGSPIKSTCSDVSSKCDEIDQATLDANGDLTCTITPSHVLYTQPAAGGSWAKHAAVWCDTAKGHWQTGDADRATNVVSLGKDDLVICAPPDKLPDRILRCPALAFDCEPGHDADPTGCVPVVDPTETTLACPQSSDPLSANNLYFKHKNEHYQQATAVKCDTVTGKWTVTYKYGIREDDKKELELSDRVICAKKNPEPSVCRLITSANKDIKGVNYIIQKYKSASEPTLPDEPSRGAGDTLSCIDLNTQSFISSTKSDVLTSSVKPVCSQSGKWEKPVPNSATKAYEEYGDQVAVATIKCKHICNVPKGITVTNNIPFIPNVNLNYVEKTEGGTCTTLKCKSGDNYFAIKDENNDVPLLFFNGIGAAHVECEGGDKWKLVKEQLIGVAREINVKFVDCVQQLHCLSRDFAKAGTPPCPAGDKYSTAGCVQLVDVHPYTPTESYDKISCPEGKKLFVQKTESTGGKSTSYWYELKEREINCIIQPNNPSAGTWDAKLASGVPFPIESDPSNSFFCADSNPDERPTTTTTTTTAAPPLPICTLCENHLPKAESCNNCVNNTKLAANSEDSECVMTAIDPKEYQILIGEATEVDELICDREEPISWFERRCETEKVNGKDNVTCKAHGARVARFNARKKAADGKWKPMVYVVIAVTLILIGGMGIGCVMIFLRMRKDLSEKEKKKERGVTKKYTTANVMKTSGKSSGGRSELGKSKEPTKSKMEENEDAPTLKL